MSGPITVDTTSARKDTTDMTEPETMSHADLTKDWSRDFSRACCEDTMRRFFPVFCDAAQMDLSLAYNRLDLAGRSEDAQAVKTAWEAILCAHQDPREWTDWVLTMIEVGPLMEEPAHGWVAFTYAGLTLCKPSNAVQMCDNFCHAVAALWKHNKSTATIVGRDYERRARKFPW